MGLRQWWAGVREDLRDWGDERRHAALMAEIAADRQKFPGFYERERALTEYFRRAPELEAERENLPSFVGGGDVQDRLEQVLLACEAGQIPLDEKGGLLRNGASYDLDALREERLATERGDEFRVPAEPLPTTPSHAEIEALATDEAERLQAALDPADLEAPAEAGMLATGETETARLEAARGPESNAEHGEEPESDRQGTPEQELRLGPDEHRTVERDTERQPDPAPQPAAEPPAYDGGYDLWAEPTADYDDDRRADHRMDMEM
jgi:hypothetical protein